jgi:hypothetical protein
MGAMNGPEFARFLRRFLTVAQTSPFNYVVVMDGAGAGGRAHRDGRRRRTPFVLTAIGLALTMGGNAVVSSRIAEPITVMELL